MPVSYSASLMIAGKTHSVCR